MPNLILLAYFGLAYQLLAPQALALPCSGQAQEAGAERPAAEAPPVVPTGRTDGATQLPGELRGAVEAAAVKHGAPAAIGGWEYKTVAGPAALAIKKKDGYAQGVRAYADIIQREAVGGWEFSHIQEVPVSKSPGCLGALMGKSSTTLFFNMLVFRKAK